MARPGDLDLNCYDAVLFDLDGVLTATAARHAECWKRTFDGLLAEHEHAPCDGDVEAFPGSVRWVQHLRAAGLRTAVVSSSTNARDVLRAAGIDRLFDMIVDGSDLEAHGLNGKPAPDGFLEAAARLGVAPSRAVVVEDALAGVTAGTAGAFGLVIGVARTAKPAELRAAGAHVVVADLDEMIPVEPPAQIVERHPDSDRMAAHGHLGIRGAPEEGARSHDPGVSLNGLHETWPIHYPEDAHGLARAGQTIVNATDGSIIRLFVDDEPVDLTAAGPARFERVLGLGTGGLSREVEWETPRGRRVLIRSRRLAPLEDRHLAAMDYEVIALDDHVAVRSDGRRAVVQLATRTSGLERPRTSRTREPTRLTPRRVSPATIGLKACFVNHPGAGNRSPSAMVCAIRRGDASRVRSTRLPASTPRFAAAEIGVRSGRTRCGQRV